METNHGDYLKEIISIANPLIKTVIETLVTPKLIRFREKFHADANRHLTPTDSHFQEYFFRTYKRLSVINTLVFNNSLKLLKDIYIPLTLNTLSANYDAKYKFDGYPVELVNKFNKILITDTAGMGKSTLMKRLFLDIIDKKAGIPIIIELRRLSKDKNILDEIYEQLNAINEPFDKQLLNELLIDGEFIIILDGYDEIGLIDRDTVTKELQIFISKASLCTFFLTSRPENALKSFGDFIEFRIEPLRKREAFELLRKYDLHGEVSSLLIKKLKEPEMQSVEEFLTNPLLVSLLYTAFEHKQVIPFKKHIFYRQVYDANFESHDLTKGDSYMHDKYSGLDIDDFHRILRFIGYNSMKSQKIEFSKDELLLLITRAREFCVGLNFSSSDYFRDLLSTVPLFTQDGVYYRWAHKSLHEYFAAQFIYIDAKQHQEELLKKMYNNKDNYKYYNVLDLYYDIDYKMFRNVFIYSLVSDYFIHTNKNYNNTYSVPEEEILKRKAITFSATFNFIPLLASRSKDYEEIYPIEEIASKQGVSLSDFHGIVFKYDNLNKELVSLVTVSNLSVILNLLLSKKNPIVSDISTYFTKSIDNYDLNVSLVEEYVLLCLDDSPSNSLNSTVNFSEISHCASILYVKFVGDAIIIHSQAIKYKNEIEEDMRRETATNFLLKDL